MQRNETMVPDYPEDLTDTEMKKVELKSREKTEKKYIERGLSSVT